MKKTSLIGLLIVIVFLLAGGGYYWFIEWSDHARVVTVNGEKVSAADFKADLAKLDPAYQELLRENPEAFMEGYVNHLLLLQQARKEELTTDRGRRDDKGAIIQAYLEKKTAALPPIAPEAVERFYEQNKKQMGGRQKKEMASLIWQMLEEQQRQEWVQKLVADLRKNAKIDVNQKNYREIITATASGSDTQTEADFRKAIAGGKPMVVDFGANSCIPCRQLRPILQKVQKTYAGKLEVLIIDIRYNQKLAAEYKIQVIPTVVFFDRTGKEVFRHQGFMTEEKIKEQLVKVGVN